MAAVPETTPDVNEGERLVNEREAAARLGLSVKTLRRWRWAKRGLPWCKIGSAVRYAPSDIRAQITAGRQSTGQAA
jgi:predicted DNA-binding transcriptional regulator AlpA